MSKKKKATRGNPAKSPKRVESNTRIVDAYRASRSRRGLNPDDSWLIGAALDLKRDYIGSTDPRLWDEDDVTFLLTRLVPSKVLLEEVDRQVLPEVFEDFLHFMADTGRWLPESFPPDEIGAIMGRLRGPLERSLADTSQRSLGGNIAAFAQAQGVDFADQAAVQRFFEQYNSMSIEDRTSISDGHGLHGGETGTGQHLTLVPDPSDDDGDLYPEFDDVDYEEIWPTYLGGPEDLVELMDQQRRDRDFAADAADLNTLLFQRADHILKWLGDGRKITSTAALRPADTLELMAELGLPEVQIRSMWDVATIAGPWSLLQGTGFVRREGSRAVRNEGYPERVDEDTGSLEEVLDYRALFHINALTVLLDPLDDEPFLENPVHTFMALVKAALPGGLALPPVIDPEDPDDPSSFMTRVDLFTLESMGLISIDDEEEVVHCPAVLLPILLTLPATFAEGLEDADD